MTFIIRNEVYVLFKIDRIHEEIFIRHLTLGITRSKRKYLPFFVSPLGHRKLTDHLLRTTLVGSVFMPLLGRSDYFLMFPTVSQMPFHPSCISVG